MKKWLPALLMCVSATVSADDLSRAEKCDLFYEELVDLHRQQFFYEISLWELLIEVEVMYSGEFNDDFNWCMEQLRLDILPSAQPGMITPQPEQSA